MSGSPTRWTPSSPRCGASRCSSRRSTRPRRRRKTAASRSARRAVDPKNLAVFVRQFSVMIDAGLPLVQCLEILGTQEEDKNFAAVILATRGDVESGASLADAMKKHPKVFDPLFTNMIAAGEAGGILDTILKRLATYIEKSRQAEGAGQVGDDLPGRGRRHRRPSSSASSCGRSFRPSRTCSPGSAPSCRCRRASSSRSATTWCASVPSSSSASARLGYGFKSYYATPNGRRVDRRHRAEAADPRHPDAQDRRRALLPHAVDAAGLGRVDSRSARHHREDRRQRRSSRKRFRRRARASSAVKRSRSR